MALRAAAGLCAVEGRGRRGTPRDCTVRECEPVNVLPSRARRRAVQLQGPGPWKSISVSLPSTPSEVLAGAVALRPGAKCCVSLLCNRFRRQRRHGPSQPKVLSQFARMVCECLSRTLSWYGGLIPGRLCSMSHAQTNSRSSNIRRAAGGDQRHTDGGNFGRVCRSDMRSSVRVLCGGTARWCCTSAARDARST